MFLVETWLSESDSNVLLPLSNIYSIFRSERADGRRGGGVAVLIPKSMSSMSVSNHSLHEFESVWCKIVTEQKTIKIGVIYRPPGHAENMPDKLITHLENQIDVSVPTIVAGDFNYGHIDWQNCTATRQYGQEKFMNFILGQGMSQLITFPTRKQAILDLLFVNEPNFIGGA